jgi:SAM-dependent methyltransferase
LSEVRADLNLVGLDISNVALQAASVFSQHLNAQANFCCGDVFALPFQSETFDLIFSQGLLEHFRAPASALREQVRVLAHGGHLVISVPQTYTGYTLHKRLAIRRGVWPWGWEGQFSRQRLVRLGCEQGLRLVESFGYQYWLSWGEPAWILRDLSGKIHRRNPWHKAWVFDRLHRAYETFWDVLEQRWGHLFMQNLVAVFRRAPR